MAWFKNAASDTPTPVTLTRLAGALDRIDFPYDLSKDQIGTGFNGFPMKLSLVGDGAFILAEAFAVDKYLPKDRFPEVVRWANSSPRMTLWLCRLTCRFLLPGALRMNSWILILQLFFLGSIRRLIPFLRLLASHGLCLAKSSPSRRVNVL